MSFVKFHSKSGGDFFFTSEVQKAVFEVLGRPVTASGAISPEEAAEWIRKLVSAVNDEKKRAAAEDAALRKAKDAARAAFRTGGIHSVKAFEDEEKLEEEEKERASRVSLEARVFPLLLMLRWAAEDGEMVMWGVP